ncbi:hypothetical protein [Actinomadura verrucosospora]|uniref:Esterase n=1 Tax=Actinomadura verrucosospora TaxID=46165 RepID=A0A7D3VXS7_ACTVE|nr:hypothetical protein [Actinomadura verrucosospora]QKG25279.1 esterase [Actinomadura verrucosospora]
MEPISAGFLALVCLPAAACLVAAVVLWPRFAGRGVRPVAARTGLLLGSQALLTAAVVLLVNRYFVFYATWDDLLGGTTTNAKVKQVQPNRGAEAAPAGLAHRVTTALGPKRRGHPRDPGKDGRVDRLDVQGARSGLDAQAYVYLPPQYFQPKYAHQRLPVVISIADDASGGAMAWLRQAKLPDEALAAAASGGVQPMIYAMLGPVRRFTPAKPPSAEPPSAGTPRTGPSSRPGDRGKRGHKHRTEKPRGPIGVTPVTKQGTAKPRDVRPAGCLDLPGVAGGQAETFLSKDLPLALAGTYRLPETRAGWGLAGLTAGGQCAARLAMLHSDLFTAAASLNGRFGLPTDGTGARTVVRLNPPAAGTGATASGGSGRAVKQGPDDPYGGSEAYRLDQDLTWRLQHLPPPPVSVLAAAQSAGADAQAAEQFAALAKPPMRVDKLLVPGNRVTLGQWRSQLPAVLAWLSAHLKGE